MKTYINLTPHDIVLNSGDVIKKSGTIARVSSRYTEFDEHGICHVEFGQVSGLPEPEEGVVYVVSGMVAAAAKDRSDVVAPATGHPECIRNEQGQIVSVPGFVKS